MRRIPWRAVTCLFLAAFTLSACGSAQVSDFEDREPKLELEAFFDGQTEAWGVFHDRFGTLRREFQVEIDGDWNPETQTLVLDEAFSYADGETDRRVWTIEKLGEGRYEGSADDVIGVAEGEVAGNALHWTYQMDMEVGDSVWRVTFDDWMYLQPGGVLINRAEVSRWGFNIGTVTIFFARPGQLGET